MSKKMIDESHLNNSKELQICIIAIKIFCVIAVIALIVLSARVAAVIATVFPFLVGLVYLIQCKKVGHGIWKTIWRQTSNFLQISAFLIGLLSYMSLRIMNFDHLLQELIFMGVLFLLLFIPSILYLKDSLNRKLVLSLMAAIGLYSLLSVYSWNYVAATGYTDFTIAEVEHRYYRGGGRHGLNKYELTVKMPDETKKVLTVGAYMYRSAETGDYVRLRHYKSCFGLDYIIVHGIVSENGVEYR